MYKPKYDNGVSSYQSKIEIDPSTLPAEYTPPQPSGVDPNKRLSDLTADELAIINAYSDARRFAQVVVALTPGDVNGNALASGSYLPMTQLSAVTVTTGSTKLISATDVSTATEIENGIQPAPPKMLQISNLGSYGIFLNFGAAAVADKGFYIPANGQMILNGLDIPKCDVYAIANGGSTKIVLGLI